MVSSTDRDIYRETRMTLLPKPPGAIISSESSKAEYTMGPAEDLREGRPYAHWHARRTRRNAGIPGRHYSGARGRDGIPGTDGSPIQDDLARRSDREGRRESRRELRRARG